MNQDNKKIVIKGREYDHEKWMEDMDESEINYMLKARYVNAFFKWYPDL